MNLEEARSAIEDIGRQIIGLIVKRQEYSFIIAGEKIKSGLAVRDEAQRDKVIKRASALARDAGLKEDQVIQIFTILVEMNEKEQEKYI